MRIFQNMSIRHKQMLIIMLITSVALLLACAAFVSFEMINFRKDMVQNLSTLAKIMGNNTSAALDFNDPQSAEETLFALKSQPNIIGACVFSRKGDVFAKYDRPDDNIIFTPPSKSQATGYSFGKNNLAIFETITSKGDDIGMIYVESDMRALHTKLAQYVSITATVFILTLFVAFLLSSRLQRLVSGPILHLSQVAQRVAQDKNYSWRAKKQSNDEIGRLVDGFNEMLAQIQQRDAALQSAQVELEARVVERTAELAKTNEELQLENAERKRAEESLRLLGSAVEQSKESILITDAELDLPGPKIIFVNPAFTQMTGYTAADAIGKTPRILQGARTDKTVLSRLRQNLERGEMFSGEAVNYRKDGKEFNLEWQIAPLRNAGGKVTHFVAIQRDITERKRLEAQLFQSQKLETVGKLAGGIAHEFNSILTAILGQSELLLGDLPAGSPLAKNAAEISKAAGRAATLTRQLLAYGRKQFLHPDILDLNRVIASMEGVLHHLMGGVVDTQIVPAPGLHAVKADAGQIEQMIINMVINARDAMPNGGKLTLETANVLFDQESVGRYPELKPGDYVMLAITDTGAGMSEGVKARLFEPFFSTKGVGQGTGLGLSTCYGIVKQSGGHISVYSEQGRGTTFKIYLPQVESQTKIPLQRLDSPDLPGGTETILLVEDDPALREMAATLLGRLGYKVLAAANGVEALILNHQRDAGHIDLLFTDVVMPHMSGRELADRVRALYPRTKILFTSAYTENAIVHQGVLDKGVALLQKPFTPSALARKLREVLDPPNAPKPDAVPEAFGARKSQNTGNTP
jgi:PAS domain S-box-containing protein